MPSGCSYLPLWKKARAADRICWPLFVAILCTLLAVDISAVWGQSYSVRTYRTEDGLSQGSIKTILEDRFGFIWVGTNDGLNKFDGVNFAVFRNVPGNPASISSNLITSIIEDSAGSLWIGTEKGLNRFRPETDSFERIACLQADSGAASYPRISSVAEVRIRGVRTIVASGEGVWILDNVRGALVRLPFEDAPVQRIANDLKLAGDQAGFLWMGSGEHLMRYDPIADTIDRDYALSGLIRCIVVHPRTPTRVLVGTDRGLYQVNPSSKSSEGFLPGVVSAIAADSGGLCWVGMKSGLQRAAMGKPGLKFSNPPDSSAVGFFSGKDVLSVCVDRSGGIWVGTFYALFRLDPHMAAFQNYRHDPKNANTLASDFVMPIIEDRSGSLWFGTFDAGVSIRTSEGKFRVPSGVVKPGTNVRSLLEDRNGDIWVGSSEGVHKFSPSTGRLVDYHKFPPEAIRGLYHEGVVWCESLAEGKDGTIWAGVSDGLLTIRPRASAGESPLRGDGVIKFSAKDAEFSLLPLGSAGEGRDFAVHELRTIVEDRRGDIWLGTENGLIQYSPASGQWRAHRTDAEDSSTLSHNSVWSIVEDPTDAARVLWVGTSQGFNRFDVEQLQYRRYLDQEGFPNSCVYTILRDDWGRFWLSTNHGLTCFDDRKPPGRKFRNYDVSDGLPGNEFNRRSAARLRNGDFVFGGTNGVTRFHPAHVRDNPYVPPVVITGFLKSGNRVPVAFSRDSAEIVLDYTENDFVISFAALNFTNASRNQYAYVLQDYERRWIPAGTERSVRYMNIEPGEYLFRVKASNNDGIWNEEGAMIALRIVPPFWKRWWFRAGAFLLLPLLVYVYFRRRTAALMQQERMQREFSHNLLSVVERERSRLAGELHDSLVQSLLVAKNRALIGLRSAGEKEKIERELSEISGVVSGAIEEVRSIAHNLRPYQLDRLGLTKAILSLGSSVNESAATSFSVEVDSLDECFSRDQSILVYRIIQEGIANILKHSGASAARIVVRKSAGAVDLSISDNGRGFAVSGTDWKRDGGFGLSGIAQRVQMLGGTCKLRSEPGSGTEVTIQIPIPRPTP